MYYKKLISFIFFIFLIFSCKQQEIKEIKIPDDLFHHQTYFQNKTFCNLIEATLQRDHNALLKLTQYDCQGGALCYDLGITITQIVYQLGEKDVVTMLQKVEHQQYSGLRDLIRAGLAYGYNEEDINPRLIESEFPTLNKLLSEN